MLSDSVKTIWICVGIPASGKDTWAKEQMQKYPGKYKRINKDLLRLMLDNDKFDFQNEKFILDTRDKIAESALNKGYDLIISDTNFPPGGKHFKRMCEIAQKVGNVRVIEKFFDVSLKEALARDGNPNRKSVGPDVIKTMYDKHIKNKSFTCQDLFFGQVKKIEYNPDLSDCVIFDVDGTLAHMNGKRGPFEWHNVDKDDPDENIIQLADIFHQYITKLGKYGELEIIIMTGRDGVALEKTKQWLADVGVVYDKIFIRDAGDMRKDSIIKREIYEREIKDKYNVIVWVDDRSQVVDMARSLGLTVLQCNWGDF
jgi:predicted kinase